MRLHLYQYIGYFIIALVNIIEWHYLRMGIWGHLYVTEQGLKTVIKLDEGINNSVNTCLQMAQKDFKKL